MCKYCEIEAMGFGKRFNLTKDYKIHKDDKEITHIAAETSMVLMSFCIRKGRSAYYIGAEYFGENADYPEEALLTARAEQKINYCPFCGRNLMSDYEKANSTERAKRAMLLMRQKTKGAADAES